ncbi:MAG: hypothetical protein D6746_08980 [Bacteroidetes bacterium]|nr:MAG: hypothetical protein D6746_08980 [Bacteroidota bacterium]
MLTVETSSGRWGPFCEQIAAFLAADVIALTVDGQTVRGYRSPDSPALWIRDHSDILRAGRYFTDDVQSAVDAFARQQARNGRLFDFVTTRPMGGRENWETWVRVPVEADVEYRFVKAAFLAWQASGDDDWIARLLPALDRALVYTTTHPWRWDAHHGLVKRPYTIDTWDFDFTAGRHPWLNFQITDETFWGIMHGDNSGLYEAALLLARLYDHIGAGERAAAWRARADAVRAQANRLLFNGRYYTHFYRLGPVPDPGADEAEQLSLSNPMAINRGLADHAIAVSILREYRRRREAGSAFAEWFSIDPPFPAGTFGDERLVPGAYCNGGIMPLVGGELARAAFEHGFERYGVETLEQYRAMIAAQQATYLWYFPDGTPSSVETSTSPEATATDGWGASAMLWAFVEGLCGVVDRAHSFRRVRLAPRWVAAGERRAAVQVGYPAGGGTFGYRCEHDPEARTIRLEITSSGAEVSLHLLLPPGRRPVAARWDGADVPFTVERVEESTYAAMQRAVTGSASVEVTYAGA